MSMLEKIRMLSPAKDAFRPGCCFRARADAAMSRWVIEIGDGEPLRHVQQLEPEAEAELLLDLLSTGTHDEVYNRSMAAASELMEKL